MIFVNSVGWFASVVADDADYEKAKNWLNENKEPLFTTNYIVDETLTRFGREAKIKRLQKSVNCFSTVRWRTFII